MRRPGCPQYRGASGLQIEGVIAGEADFDEAAAAVHAVHAGMDEIAVVENVAGRGHQIHAGQGGLEDLHVAADGSEFEFARALRANQRAAGGLDDDVAGDFLQMNIAATLCSFMSPLTCST